MRLEYLLFNIIVVSGPIFFGSLRRFYFMDRWREAVLSSLFVAVPYLIWDALVTDRHWMFNQEYVLGITLFRLPLEEWLFFLTVPFACLFTWEMILKVVPDSSTRAGDIIRKIFLLMPVMGIIVFINGEQYSGLVLLFLSLAVLLDKVLNTNLVNRRSFYLYIILIIGFILIFNGYLTWRPVVLYDESFQLGIRIFTIPVEDFGYGISLLFLCTVIFEKIKMYLKKA